MKAIIFDLDGVLVNTPAYVRQADNIFLKKYEIRLSEEDYKDYVGMSTRNRVRSWNRKYNIQIDEEEFSQKFIKTLLDLMKDELQFDGQLVAMMRRLSPVYKLAIATASVRPKAEIILEKLGIIGFFDVIITAEQIVKHKPDPETYIVTAEKLGVKRSECIVLEDSVNGIRSAKAADMKVVALRTDRFSSEELAIADYIVDYVTDIEEKLTSS